MAGKRISPKKRHWTPFVVILAVAALVATIGGTMAWLTASPNGLTNTFTPANVYAEVQESFDGTTKSNVKVYNGYTDEKGNKHNSDAPVYIRVALVPTWEDDSNTAVAIPASLSDLNITFGSAKWVLSSDGYYYYTEKVAAGGTTEALITSATVNEDSAGYQAGYHMNLQVLAQNIQAEPDEAVRDAWETGVSAVDNGFLTIIAPAVGN